MITLISMDIFESNMSLKSQAMSIIQQNRKSGKDEAIYFKDVIKPSTNILKQFSDGYLEAFANRIETGKFGFSERVGLELKRVREKGKAKADPNQISLFSTDNWDFDYVLMGHIGSYIHFPYSELYENIANPDIYYAYDPLNPIANQTEVFWHDNNQPYSQWEYGEETWAMEHATWVFLLDDLIAGNHMDYFEFSPCANGEFLGYLCENELLTSREPEIQLDSVPPPPNPSYNGPLQNNIPPFAHSTISNDKYLLSATIPRIRLKGNVRFGFWSGPNRISMYRGNARIANPYRQNFSEAILDTSLPVFREISISRNSARNWNWNGCDAVYTNQWRQEQVDNHIVVTYVASWLYFAGADIDFQATAGVKWDTSMVQRTVIVNGQSITITTQKGWVPQFDASAKVSGKISIRKREKVLGEIPLSRASFMAQAIGNNFGLGTCANTGASQCEKDWSIRAINGSFEYFFRINITH